MVDKKSKVSCQQKMCTKLHFTPYYIGLVKIWTHSRTAITSTINAWERSAQKDILDCRNCIIQANHRRKNSIFFLITFDMTHFTGIEMNTESCRELPTTELSNTMARGGWLRVSALPFHRNHLLKIALFSEHIWCHTIHHDKKTATLGVMTLNVTVPWH